MAFDVFLTDEALADVGQIHDYLSAFDPKLADRILSELDRILRHDIAARPLIYAAFYLTGAPFRGRLFRISRRTQYWIVYEVDEVARLITILRIWNASRDPTAFEL